MNKTQWDRPSWDEVREQNTNPSKRAAILAVLRQASGTSDVWFSDVLRRGSVGSGTAESMQRHRPGLTCSCSGRVSRHGRGCISYAVRRRCGLPQELLTLRSTWHVPILVQ